MDNKILFVVQFSGGKDSLSTLLWAVNRYGKDDIVAVFCDTRWEHELTYKHIKEVIARLGVTLITLKGKYSFLELVRKKLRFPSPKARFCTEELKIKPFIDWVLSLDYNYMEVLQGIRGNESKSRSKMTPECQYFKYYFTPYLTNSMIVAELGSKGKLTFKQKNKLVKAEARLALGKEDPKYMTYRKKEIREKELLGKTDIYRPFFNSTANEVMTYIKQNGFKPNPLYYMGFSRVGCFPCIMCTKSEIDLIIKKEPKYLDRIMEAEKTLHTTFFPPDYIPKRAQEMFNGRKGLQKLPTIQSVIRYIKGKAYKGEMFADEESKSCTSMYNICE